MIEINLIPDVKQEYLKAQNNKRIVITLSFLISVGFVALVLLLLSFVTVIQGGKTDDLDRDINDLLAQYQAPEDTSKVITVDRQLSVLPSLHEEKPDLTRLSGYLAKLIPPTVTIDNIQLDINNGIMIVKGQGKNTVAIDTLVNTLNNAVYYINPGESGDSINVSRVFTDTTLERFGTGQGAQATFEIRAGFDTQIFNNALDIVLSVPKTSSDETDFKTPEDLTIDAQEGAERTDDLFEPIQPEEVE